MNTIKRYAVTAIETSDISDCKPRVRGIFKTKDEAKNYVNEDIKEWIDEHAGQDVSCDFEWMSASYRDDNWDDTYTKCEWNIEEVEIEL